MCGFKTDILDGEVSRTLYLERAKCRDRSSGSEKDTNLGGGGMLELLISDREITDKVPCITEKSSSIIVDRELPMLL